jgi:rubrerythrin
MRDRLSIEKQLDLRLFSDRAKDLSDEELKRTLLELFALHQRQTSVYKELVKEKWGFGQW